MSDTLHTELVRLLACVEDALSDNPPCKAFVAPGASAPWDQCCDCRKGDGQVWVLSTRLYPTRAFPVEDTAPRCRPSGFAATVEVGVLRCAATVDDDGVFPRDTKITSNAETVGRDREAVREALLCCFADQDCDPGVFLLGDWMPLGPDGGCVGGRWAATIAVASR